jgi:hypothetical protein
MEFASEMVVKATIRHLRIAEVPTTLSPDGRSRPPHLRSWRDGWRHLRFLLLHSPKHLFILPGAAIATLGALICVMVAAHIDVLGRQWAVHTLIGGSLLLIVGSQIVSLGLCALAYATYFMGEQDLWFERMSRRCRLEHGLMLGAGVALLGVAMVAVVVLEWIQSGFGNLVQERVAIAAATLVVLGTQIAFTSFLLSILGLRRR